MLRFSRLSCTRLRTAGAAPVSLQSRSFSTELSPERRKLLFRSKQTGMLEVDLVFGTWAEQNIAKLDDADFKEFAAIVAAETNDLNNWIIKREPVPEQYNGKVMKQVLEYAHGKGKKWHVASGQVGPDGNQ